MEDFAIVVTSRLSQKICIDEFAFDVNIYRFEEQATWTLEVIEPDGSSHIWSRSFASEKAALLEAMKSIRAAGAFAFIVGVGTKFSFH